MWGVAKIFTSGHSKGGGSTEPPLATGMTSSYSNQPNSNFLCLIIISSGEATQPG